MTPEIIAIEIELMALSAAAYMLYRQQVVIDRQARALDAYKHALAGEKADHAETHARLVEAKRTLREECL
jgi:hypothetical protein